MSKSGMAEAEAAHKGGFAGFAWHQQTCGDPLPAMRFTGGIVMVVAGTGCGMSSRHAAGPGYWHLGWWITIAGNVAIGSEWQPSWPTVKLWCCCLFVLVGWELRQPSGREAAPQCPACRRLGTRCWCTPHAQRYRYSEARPGGRRVVRKCWLLREQRAMALPAWWPVSGWVV